MAAKPAAATLLVALLADGRHEASLGLCASLLGLQNRLASSEYAPSLTAFDDAAQALQHAKDGDFDACLLVNTMKGFEAEMVTAALESPHQFVVGVYPQAAPLDWAAVAKRAAGGAGPRESVRDSAYVYNVETPPGALPDADGYVPVTSADLGVAVLKREALRAVAGAPDACAAWKPHGTPVASLNYPCRHLGPAQFFGCVGMRRVLR